MMKTTDLKMMTCNLRPDLQVLLLKTRAYAALIRLYKFYSTLGTYVVASILITICRRSSQEHDSRK